MPPTMRKDTWQHMAAYLRSIDTLVGRRPRAVLVISAHWMTSRPTLGNSPIHPLYFDYYNFPAYTYQLTYPAAGAPEVAARVAELLADAGIPSDMDAERGIDHGVFVPFKLIYPDADVPIVPMSLQQGLDAAAHIAIGRALEPLRDEGILIVASGMSSHNMRAMMMGTHSSEANIFDQWLTAASLAPAAERNAALSQWTQAPAARAAHPVEEHLIPLMVAAGAGGADLGRKTYSDTLGGKALSGFTFG